MQKEQMLRAADKEELNEIQIELDAAVALGKEDGERSRKLRK